MQYLYFNGEKLPRPDDYSIDIRDILSDGSGETEAGTQQRDFKRRDVVKISVSFTVTPKWLVKFKHYKESGRLSVRYHRAGAMATEQMYIDEYQENLEHETLAGGIWKVSFTLNN